MCLELREKANEATAFISRIIKDDKSWIHGYDPETKQQSSQLEIVHCELVPPNIMVNSDFYCDVLRSLRENV
jgi:hypothetical protein